MSVYCFWNNKGGTGKTSLAFQTVCLFARENPNQRILVLDLCPQANLTELLVGGITKGGENLQYLIDHNRMTVGGYFQERILSPYRMAMNAESAKKFLANAATMNRNIPSNVDLLAGDPLVELQSNSISEQATAQLPGENAWARVIGWLNDFIEILEPRYDTVFIDANPSFSIYTQIALACTDYLIIPTMADDSSKRAIINVLSLVYGIDMPNEKYRNVAFSEKMKESKKSLPKIKLVVKNRLTQYMTPATAYGAVLSQIDNLLLKLIKQQPEIFEFTDIAEGMVEVRDFGTTGVVSFVEAVPFYELRVGRHKIGTKKVQINASYQKKCADSINEIYKKM